MLPHSLAQEPTFYAALQELEGLDLRDTRGLKHNLAFVLLGVIIGILRNRDGKLSSVHRSMVNMGNTLSLSLGIANQSIVSRAQLPRILNKVSYEVLEGLMFQHYGIELSQQERQWFAGDGKELRGSIEKGNKRGIASVQLIRHEDGAVAGQSFYNGTKESEKPCLEQLLVDSGVQSQQITADALHLHPNLTQDIHQAGGTFVIGLKENQQELLQDMVDHTAVFAPKTEHRTDEKGHGRLESRRYACFDVSEEYFDPRWDKSGFSSLIRVERTRTALKTNESTQETAYYISNGKSENALEYFKAVRNHWAVEVNNHYRDVSLREDQLRTKETTITKTLATIRTLVLELFRKWKPKNLIAQMERFQDNFEELIEALKKIRFL